MKKLFYILTISILAFSCGSNGTREKNNIDNADSSDISSGTDMIENGSISEQFALKLENITSDQDVEKEAIDLFCKTFANTKINEKVEGFYTLNDYLIKYFSTLFDEKGITEKFKAFVTGIDSSASIAQQYKTEVEAMGVKLGHDEGYLYLTIDQDFLLDKMGNACPDGLRLTLKVSPLINKEVISDAAIILEPNEMANYLIALNTFIVENPSHPLITDAKDKLKTSMQYVMNGVDNTPLLNEDGKLTEYFSEMMKIFKAKYESNEVVKTIFSEWKSKGIKIKK